MGLSPTLPETIARARGDLRLGVPVVLTAPGQAAVFVAAETLSTPRLAALRQIGQPVLAITQRRAETLKARAYDGDLARIHLPHDADLRWIEAIADPADDLAQPLKGPLHTERAGAADMHRAALLLSKAARLLPAAVGVTIAPTALPPGLTVIAADDVMEHSMAISTLDEIVSAHVPLATASAARLHIFRPEDGGEEHYAVEIGSPARDQPVLTRLHSACFTGDLLGSLKCDCGPQLNGALTQMGQAGAGILLYLNQEGRGIGLANKMRAYALQDQGFDTVEANHRLGFEDDERDFRVGAQLLGKMGFATVRLMTNNPGKVRMLESCGIKVAERVPLRIGRGPLNAAYLDTKAAKSGHLL
ncbi:MAG: GTP cyclohydrolase II [Qingshengfaniella sp.]